MWGPALFLLTIVMVTASGRDAVYEFWSEYLARYTADMPYSEGVLIFMALCALASLLIIRGRKTKEQQVCWLWRRVTAEAAVQLPEASADTLASPSR